MKPFCRLSTTAAVLRLSTTGRSEESLEGIGEGEKRKGNLVRRATTGEKEKLTARVQIELEKSKLYVNFRTETSKILSIAHLFWF
jgi:hypothetical protein